MIQDVHLSLLVVMLHHLPREMKGLLQELLQGVRESVTAIIVLSEITKSKEARSFQTDLG